MWKCFWTEPRLIKRPILSFLHSPFLPPSLWSWSQSRAFAAEPLAENSATPPPPLHLYTLIIGHHLPDLSLTSLLSTQRAHRHSPLTLCWYLGSQVCRSCCLSQLHICPCCLLCNPSVFSPSYTNKLCVNLSSDKQTKRSLKWCQRTLILKPQLWRFRSASASEMCPTE